MTYKIDKKLPWFEARTVLKEDMYVNIISETHSEELNPNGLFSGFLSGCIFFTSRWNGFEFEPLEIRLEDIDQVLFLEVLESEKVKKDFRKDSLNKEEPKSSQTTTEEALKKLIKEMEKKRNTMYPGSNPYNNKPFNFPKDYNDLGKTFREFPKIILGSENLETLLSAFSTQSNPDNKTK